MKHIIHFAMTAFLAMGASGCHDLYTDISSNQGYLFLDEPVLDDLSISDTNREYITLKQPILFNTGIPSASSQAYIGVDGSISINGSRVSGAVQGPVDVTRQGCTFSNLNPETTYRIFVVAKNISGYSVKDATQQTIPADAYYIDSPVYYSQCENENDFFEPMIGSEFDPCIVKTRKGSAAGWTYIPAPFNYGLQVYNRNKTDGCYARAWVYPFNNIAITNKPDLSRGTCAFWASANGEWSHEGDDDTDVYGEVFFYLADRTYFRIHASSDGHVCSVNFYVKGAPIFGGTTVPKKQFISVIVQWDLVEGFTDGTNFRFYCNGTLHPWSSSLVPDDINNFVQYFYLQSRTNNGGEERPDRAGYGSIDNIILWNKIVASSDILLLE
ncbi:MAG: hypothetical protein JXA07_02605 [Spirochaetes bacterium]|nr:hypothetical protein [Spirochaetota bacterium]